MATRVAVGLKTRKVGASLELRRCIHAFGSMMPPPSSPPMVLPEAHYIDDINASFDLMAVPKNRVSHSRKRIRNAPKFLKPAPVILRCTVCGRVKLPHFFCCSGIKEDNGRQG